MNSINYAMENKSGLTIFQICVNIYLAYTANSEITKSELKELRVRLESIFLILLDKAALDLNNNQLKSILEKTDKLGKTVAYQTSKFSEKILSKLCEYKISMNQITANFEVIELNYHNLISKMIKLGVNPRIFNLFESNQHQILEKNQWTNKNLIRQSLNNSKSIYFGIEDEMCGEDCSNPCRSNFKRYVVNNGIFLDPFKTIHIGSGSHGRVFSGIWHSTPAAFKFIPIKYYNSTFKAMESFFDLQANISEFFLQQSTLGQNILQPIGFYRQQIQKSKTKFYHFDVIVYPLCSCNLYQLLKSQYFSDDQIGNILDQCLKRKE